MTYSLLSNSSRRRFVSCCGKNNSNRSNTVRFYSTKSSQHSKGKIERNLLTKVDCKVLKYQKENKVMVITGATGEIAPGIIERAIARGYKVVACSRRKKRSINPEILQWVQIKEEDIGNSNVWNELLEKLAKNASRISAVNLIGAAVAPVGKKLEDINVKPALALHSGLESFAEDHPEIAVTMVHLSSICASVLLDSHPYSAMRKYVDDTITTSADKVNAVVLRPGLVFNNLGEGNMVNMGHPYSPEQFATLPIHPVIGSGNQIQQPVYQEDLSDAIINATYATEDAIIDAVGPESMTQAEMFKFFVDLRGGTFRMVRIPYSFGHVMASHFPKGRIAPYSIAAFERLDDPADEPFPVEPFQAYVGHELKSMSDVYLNSNEEDGPIILARPPILEHIGEIASKIIYQPETRREVMSVLWKDAPELAKEFSRVIFSPTNNNQNK